MNPASSYTGVLVATDFTCTASGDITLVHGADNGDTQLTEDPMGPRHDEGNEPPETLRVNCVEPTATLPGDVDCDGIVSSIDAVLVLQFSAGLLALLPCQQNADLTGETFVIDARDATLILQITAGLLTVPAS